MGELFYLAAGGILKGRVESILAMRTCQWMAHQGFNVTLAAPRSPAAEDAPEEGIFDHYGIAETFAVRLLPRLLAWRGVLSRAGNRALMTAAALAALVRLRDKEAPVFYTKSRIAMETVLLAAELRRRSPFTVFETHVFDGREGTARMLRRTGLVVANCRLVAKMIRDAGVPEERVLQVYNGPFAGGAAPSREEARRRLGIEGAAGIVMHLGKIPEKQLEFFFDLGGRIAGRGMELHHVGGNREILARAGRMLAARGLKNIRFHGFVPPVDAALYAGAADFLLCRYPGDWPRIEQATPAKVFDYLGWGRPILCSDNTALNEILTDEENCIFFPPDDPEDLGAKIAAWSGRAQEAEGMAERNRLLAAGLGWEARSRRIAERIGELRAAGGNREG
jgi:glycosyltransferase involved in cell wall biosynthesis